MQGSDSSTVAPAIYIYIDYIYGYGLWKSCYSVCHMFVADYYMLIDLLIPYTLRLSSTVIFPVPFMF